MKNASEISSYFKGNTIASLRSARCAIFLNSSFASLAFIKKNMRNMQNFQGCVYCLILNYHGSLLRCLKQLCYYIKFVLACQEVFYSFSNFFELLLSSSNSDILSYLFFLVNNFFKLFTRTEKEGFEPSRRFPDLHP